MGEFALFASSVAVMTVIELILTGSILFPLFLFLGVYNWISNLVGIALKVMQMEEIMEKQFMIH